MMDAPTQLKVNAALIDGRTVVYVCASISDAHGALSDLFDSVRRWWSGPFPFMAHHQAGDLRLTAGNGTVRFVSARSLLGLRGTRADHVYIDGDVRLTERQHDQLTPLIMPTRASTTDPTVRLA